MADSQNIDDPPWEFVGNLIIDGSIKLTGLPDQGNCVQVLE